MTSHWEGTQHEGMPPRRIKRCTYAQHYAEHDQRRCRSGECKGDGEKRNCDETNRQSCCVCSQDQLWRQERQTTAFPAQPEDTPFSNKHTLHAALCNDMQHGPALSNSPYLPWPDPSLNCLIHPPRYHDTHRTSHISQTATRTTAEETLRDIGTHGFPLLQLPRTLTRHMHMLPSFPSLFSLSRLSILPNTPPLPVGLAHPHILA
jgi:hypothetical protein